MKRKILLVILTGFLLKTTAAQDNSLLRYLPEDAKFVMHLNLGKLSKKVSWQEITKMDFFEQLMHKAGPTAENFILNPSETGIDFSGGLYMVMNINMPTGDEENTQPENYVMLLGKMRDEKTFTSIMKKSAGRKNTMITAGANNFIIDKEAELVWNKSVFILRAKTNTKNLGHGKKSLSKKETAAIKKQLAKMVSPAAGNFYTTDSRFQQLVTQNPDIAIWSDGSLGGLAGMKKNPFAGLNLNLFTKNNYKASAINFENGRIVSQNTNWMNDSMISAMKAIYSRANNPLLLNKIPEGKPLFFLNFSMNIEEMDAYMERMGLLKMIREVMAKDSFDLDNFRGTLQGDFMMAVNMAEVKHEAGMEETEHNPMEGLQVYIAATVKDQEKMDKLVTTLKEQLAKAKERKKMITVDTVYATVDSSAIASDEMIIDTTIYEAVPPPPEELPDSIEMIADSTSIDMDMRYPVRKSPFENLKPVTSNENGLFVFSLSQDALDQYKANNSNSYFKDLAAKYGKDPMLMMIDMKALFGTIFSLMPKRDATGEDMERMMNMTNTFNKLTVHGGNIEGNKIVSSTELSFSDPSENSLMQIVKLVDFLVNTAMSQRAADKDYSYPADSTAIAVPDTLSEGVKISPVRIERKDEIQDENKVFVKAEIAPSYTGGSKAWVTYLAKNINPNIPRDNGAPIGKYTVVIQFTIDKNGKGSDYKTLTNNGYGMEKEALRVVENVEKWEPAIQNGRKVAFLYKQPVTFEIQSNQVSIY